MAVKNVDGLWVVSKVDFIIPCVFQLIPAVSNNLLLVPAIGPLAEFFFGATFSAKDACSCRDPASAISTNRSAIGNLLAFDFNQPERDHG